ncbi:hypothetical protein LCGC14_1428570 [marine sediment metagenome]|uniref:Sialidase domain-containing protein n=1 Tax=marine sediment metagenome TaxID=412755 RepID=A0A0F9MR00_9ZZZZ
MFKILGYNIVKKKWRKYLSFPDIIQSKYNKNRFFLVYRSGESHHPLNSFIHFLVSENKCQTWKEVHNFYLSLKKDGKVWNCPRLSYFPDGSLNIICDTKSSLTEKIADFNVFILKSNNKGNSFSITDSGIRGMVPDKVIPFKDKLFCANHIHDKRYNLLTQLVNISKDEGKTWHDCSILARDKKHLFCEASLINYKDNFLLAYIRDNRLGHQLICKYISFDGLNWESHGVLPVFGHRPTVILDGNRVFVAHRDTKNITLAITTATLTKKGREKNIETIDIDQELTDNKYHYGYTGMTKIDKNLYYVTYYITKENSHPFIKGCFLEWK